MVDTLDAADLEMQGARALAAIIFIQDQGTAWQGFKISYSWKCLPSSYTNKKKIKRSTNLIVSCPYLAKTFTAS